MAGGGKWLKRACKGGLRAKTNQIGRSLDLNYEQPGSLWKTVKQSQEQDEIEV